MSLAISQSRRKRFRVFAGIVALAALVVPTPPAFAVGEPVVAVTNDSFDGDFYGGGSVYINAVSGFEDGFSAPYTVTFVSGFGHFINGFGPTDTVVVAAGQQGWAPYVCAVEGESLITVTDSNGLVVPLIDANGNPQSTFAAKATSEFGTFSGVPRQCEGQPIPTAPTPVQQTVVVTPAAPVIVKAGEPGVQGSISVPAGEGYTAVVSPEGAIEGDVTVTYTLAPATETVKYVFAEGFQAVQTHNLGVFVPEVVQETRTVTITPPVVVKAGEPGVQGSITVPTGEGYTVTVDRPGAIDGKVTVTYTLLPATETVKYEFPAGFNPVQVFDLGVFVPEVVQQTVVVTPAAPVIVKAGEPGVQGSISVPAGEGYTAVVSPEGAIEGDVTVTYTLAPATETVKYVFAEGFQAVQTHNLGTYQPPVIPPHGEPNPSNGEYSEVPKYKDNVVDKVTFCHATGSESNPYVKLTTSVNAFYQAGHHTHQDKRDIVPAFSAETQGNDRQNGKYRNFDGLNWDENSQEFIKNGCKVVDEEPKPDPEDPKDPPADDADTKMVTFCHATGSESNPYVKLTTSVNAFFKAGHHTHQDGRDIVPPFTYISKGKERSFEGLNWDENSQEFIENGCKVVDEEPTPDPTDPTDPVDPQPNPDPEGPKNPQPEGPKDPENPEPANPENPGKDDKDPVKDGKDDDKTPVKESKDVKKTPLVIVPKTPAKDTSDDWQAVWRDYMKNWKADDVTTPSELPVIASPQTAQGDTIGQPASKTNPDELANTGTSLFWLYVGIGMLGLGIGMLGLGIVLAFRFGSVVFNRRREEPEVEISE